MNGVMCKIEGVVDEAEDVFSPLYQVVDLKAEVVEVHGVSVLNGVDHDDGDMNGVEEDGGVIVKVDHTDGTLVGVVQENGVGAVKKKKASTGSNRKTGTKRKASSGAKRKAGTGAVDTEASAMEVDGDNAVQDDDDDDDDVESWHEEEPQIRYATRAATRVSHGEEGEESEGEKNGWGSDFIDDDEGDYDSDVPGRYRAKQVDDSDYEPSGQEESESEPEDEIPSEDEDDPDFDEESDDSYPKRGRKRGRTGKSRRRGRTRSRSPLDDDDITFKWRKVENPREMKEFVEKVGPQNDYPDDVNELDFFQEFFTDEVWELLVTMTNLSALSNQSKAWWAVTVAEMKVFIGMIIAMGIIKLPNVELYWQKKRWFFLIPSFGKVMSRERFQQIWRYLSFHDKTLENINDDKLFEIRPLLNLLLPKFEKVYVPEKNVSIDESMIPYRGKIFFVQYSSNKRIKYGIQVWVLAESKTGYVSRFDIFTEKNRNKRLSEVGLATRVVNHLIKPFEGKGYHLYVDNFYTSPHLFKSLYEREVYACGTCKRDRRGFPSSILIMQPKEQKRGYNLWVMDGPLLAQSWLDCRPYYYMSTIHSPKHPADAPHDAKVVKRQMGGKSVDVPCPPLVHDYNTGTAGVAFNNMQRKCYDLGRKSTRWSRRVFFYLLELVAHNSLIVRNHVMLRRPTRCENSALQFRMDLVNQLIGGTRVERQYDKRPIASDVPRLVNVGIHLPSLLLKARTCKVCSKASLYEYHLQYKDVPKNERPRHKHASRTTICCEACDVPLCLSREKNCFKIWHTKVEYWIRSSPQDVPQEAETRTEPILSPLLINQS